jgi:transketolase
VVNVPTIKPLDTASLLAALSGCRALITAEEHSVVGGMGSAILEALASHGSLPAKLIGIQDQFGTSAHGYQELLDHYGLTAAAIVEAALAL